MKNEIIFENPFKNSTSLIKGRFLPKQFLIKQEEERELSITYLGFLARYADSSKKIIHSGIQEFFIFLNGNNILFNDVNQNIVNIYLDYLSKKPYKNTTYNRKVAFVKQFLQYTGKILLFKTKTRNPYGNMKIINESNLKNIFTYINNKISNNCPRNNMYLRDYLLLKLYYYTGLRKVELLNMIHSDIFYEDNNIKYQVTIKGGKEIKKIFPYENVSQDGRKDDLYKQVIQLKNNEGKLDIDFIFTGRHFTGASRLADCTVNKLLNKYHRCVSNVEQNVTVHSIRNVSGWAVQDETKDIQITREHLNHIDISTTDLYLSKCRQKVVSPYSAMADRIT